MTTLDQGELFVVTRGHEYGGRSVFAFAGIFDAPAPERIHYDRSDEGMVYRALEVCGPVVAAECVFAQGYKLERLGRRVSLNLTEIEVMPVTAAYLAALQGTSTHAAP